jgi:hypothetical protein
MGKSVNTHSRISGSVDFTELVRRLEAIHDCSAVYEMGWRLAIIEGGIFLIDNREIHRTIEQTEEFLREKGEL